MIAAIRKVQRAFDVTTPAQEAALASLDETAELERRRAVNREAMATLEAVLRERGFEPIGPAAGNFLFVDVGADAAALNDALLRRGVIVRPMGSFGAPDRAADHRGHARRDRVSRRAARRGRVFERLTALRSEARRATVTRSGRGGAPLPMRTTLKRGVGRGATLNGNGRAALPPAPAAPVTIYRQPPPPPRSGRSLVVRILGWSALVLAVLVGGTAGGVYLYAARDRRRRRAEVAPM